MTEVQEAVYGAAKGCYQEDLLRGNENWSGNSLRGKARRWGSRYHKSRENLINRIYMALPSTWRADVCLVLYDSRWHSELILTYCDGTEYMWDGGELKELEHTDRGYEVKG